MEKLLEVVGAMALHTNAVTALAEALVSLAQTAAHGMTSQNKEELDKALADYKASNDAFHAALMDKLKAASAQ